MTTTVKNPLIYQHHHPAVPPPTPQNPTNTFLADGIPDGLPDPIFHTLQCNERPRKKFNDAHCGNVLWVARDFCNHYAAIKAEAYASDKDASKHLATGPKIGFPLNLLYNMAGSGDVKVKAGNNIRIDVGPVEYSSHQYVHGNRMLNRYFYKKFDYFNLTVQSVDNCLSDQIDLTEPVSGTTCTQLMWGAWTGCEFLPFFSFFLILPLLGVAMGADSE